AHLVSVARKVLQFANSGWSTCLRRGDAEPDGAHRLFDCAAIGTCDPADRYCHLGAGDAQRTVGHLAHRLLADRAVLLQRERRHPDVTRLGGVGISNVSGMYPLGASGKVRQCLGDPTARAGLCRYNAPACGLQPAPNRFCQRIELGITDGTGHIQHTASVSRPPATLDNRALLYLLQGQLDSARADFNSALGRVPKMAWARYG